jgi:two-component system chemotaxis response regulator CheB
MSHDWWNLERMSIPCGLNCPTCKSALYELREKRMLRFRGRAGHAFSAESLLGEQADARETQLSALFGALTEEATLARRVREATQVCEWLRALTNLVEPDPNGGG